jgi:hypothetical protein
MASISRPFVHLNSGLLGDGEFAAARILVSDSDMVLLAVVMTTGIIFGPEYTGRGGALLLRGGMEKLKQMDTYG